MQCPDADTLGSLVSGGLAADERAAVANHAAACPSCYEVVSALVGTVDGSAPAAPPAPDERVDRYVIESRLGAGAMGVVYAAMDPDLGRRVAVKLLRPGAADERARREAQALARLSHPNVVAVHDVGTHRGQIFIAMALVDGDNLRAWLRTPRSVAEILRHLLAAGRGLAAAHAAGLIHRDLKPDNIFVSRAGDALVGDFGLARDLDTADVVATAATGTALPTPDLTVTGMVLGTPAYMAPEQASGDATAASDQFSFCVTAWEALYQARPFAGASVEELQAATRAGRIVEPTSDPGVPAAVRRALLRGLSADPAARFPSMEALLAAMAARRRRWPWLAAGGAVLAGAALAAVLLSSSSSARHCAATSTTPDSLWSTARRAEVERTLTARAPDATADIAGVLSAIDRYAANWTSARSGCLRDSPAACLDQRALALSTSLDLIVSADTMQPRDARRVADNLPSIDRCAHATDATPPRRSPELDRARARLAALAADLGSDRRADLATLRADAEALDDPALFLDTLLLEARVRLDRADPTAAEGSTRTALAVAESLRDDLGRAHAGALLTEALVQQNRLTEARGQLTQSLDALARGGPDRDTAVVLDRARVSLAHATGDRPTELAALQAIFESQRAHRGDDSPSTLEAGIDLALYYQRNGDPDRADSLFAIFRDALGADLPSRVASAERTSFEATQALAGGDFARCIELERQVVAIYAAMEPAGASYAEAVFGLAQSYELAGQWPAARDTYREASLLQDDPGTRADALEGIARQEIELSNPAAAIAPAREALALAITLADPERTQTGTLVLSRALVLTGHADEALTLVEPVLRDLDAAPAPSPMRRAATAYLLAQSLWSTGGETARDRARALVSDAIRDYTAGLAALPTDPMWTPTRRMIDARLASAVEWQRRHP